jgi:hypothetical protein
MPRRQANRQFLINHYLTLADIQIQQGEHAAAAATMEKFPELYNQTWRGYYKGAGFLARCSPLARRDANLSEAERKSTAKEYDERALAWFCHEAVARNPDDAEALDQIAWTGNTGSPWESHDTVPATGAARSRP